MNDWLITVFQVMAPVAIGGLVWINMKINTLIKQQALSHQDIVDLKTVTNSQSDIPGRVIKLETTIPFMVQAVEELKEISKNTQNSVQRIEVSVAKITPSNNQ